MSKAMKGEKQALVPRLRFPEFREAGEWEIKSLGDVCSVLQGYGFPTDMQGKFDGEYPFCKVSDVSKAVAENGGHLDDAANYVGKQELSKLRAKPIPVGSTVFAKIGEALRLNRRAYVSRECLIDNNVVGLKAADGSADDYFIYISSQLIDLNEHCGGAVPSVNKTTLEAVEVVVPSLDEQQKIADCLSSLDALIAAQAAKIDALKTHKIGLMQQLFPREGETIPRLRFPEFRDAGEWNEVKLSTQIELISGLHLAPSEYAHSGDIPYFTGPSDYTNDSALVNKWTNRSANVAQHGDTLVTVKGSGVGELLLLHLSEVAMGRQLMAVRAKAAHVQFVYHVLSMKRQEMIALASGNLIPGLSRGDILGLHIALPRFKEQQRIADCLSSLDELIVAHTEKLNALKAHKKGLMQQLFPSHEAVGV